MKGKDRSMARKEKQSSVSSEDMRLIISLDKRRCGVLSERDIQALRNWEEGLPSWAMD
jgi:hypothetical protein